ncbi:hypothetical protein ACIRPN_08350 [Streptomyces sp. NPDC101230]|uniref:hypothetical protein n=1 Tax=unclassified Streptomyces TaxID=2593676 RepID=UPI0037F24EA7
MSDNEAAPEHSALDAANSRALQVRALCEQVEQQVLGRTWTLPELAVGFTRDTACVGRLVPAAEGTGVSGPPGVIRRGVSRVGTWSARVLRNLGSTARACDSL